MSNQQEGSKWKLRRNKDCGGLKVEEEISLQADLEAKLKLLTD